MSAAPLGPAHDEPGGGELITEINVTPMVDIMLVLLIIFMVTASFIMRSSIPVELPRAARAEAVATPVGVVLRADGSLLLNGRRIDEKGLLAALRQRVAERRDVQAIIAGDATVSHGRVVRVIDILRRAGVTRFAINVELDERALEDVER